MRLTIHIDTAQESSAEILGTLNALIERTSSINGELKIDIVEEKSKQAEFANLVPFVNTDVFEPMDEADLPF